MLGLSGRRKKLISIFDTIGQATRPPSSNKLGARSSSAKGIWETYDLKKACSLRIPVLGLVLFDQFIQLFLARLQRAREIGFTHGDVMHHGAHHARPRHITHAGKVFIPYCTKDLKSGSSPIS